jgi:hypothetical protein
MVTIREGGVERRVTAAEAFVLQLIKRGLEGDGAASRATLAVIEEARCTSGLTGSVGPIGGANTPDPERTSLALPVRRNLCPIVSQALGW